MPVFLESGLELWFLQGHSKFRDICGTAAKISVSS